MPKKIVYLSINNFNPVLCDGVSNASLELLHYLQTRGHEVFIDTFFSAEPYRRYVFRYLLGREAEERAAGGGYSVEFQGVRVYQELLPYGQHEMFPQSRYFLRAIFQKLREQKPDYIITVEDDFLPLYAVSVAGIPGAHFFHSPAYIEAYRRQPLYAKLLKKRRVFACSRFLQDKVKEAINIEAALWHPLFNLRKYRVPKSPEGVDLGYYSAGFHKGDKVVNELIAKRPDWTFLVVGRNYTRNFQTLPPNLNLKGDLTDTTQFYGRIRVLLVPSIEEEGFPRVILEAAVNGIPAVASRIGGIPEALGRSGVLIDVGPAGNPDIEALGRDFLKQTERILIDGDIYRGLADAALARAGEFSHEQEKQSCSNYERFMKPLLS